MRLVLEAECQPNNMLLEELLTVVAGQEKGYEAVIRNLDATCSTPIDVEV